MYFLDSKLHITGLQLEDNNPLISLQKSYMSLIIIKIH